MTNGEDIWATLGIAPTPDTRAIKRAYHAKLRVTNPEDDPAAFQKLREAFETALELSEYLAEDGAFTEGAPVAESAPTAAESPPAQPIMTPAHDAPSAPPARPPDETRQTVLRQLDELSRALAAPEPPTDATLLALLDSLLRKEHLERFDLQELLDQSLATLLADHIPRSDVLLKPASLALGWSIRRDDPSLPQDAFRVLHQLSVHAYLHQLTSAGRDDAAAWKRLTGPEEPLKRWARGYLLDHSSWDEIDVLNRVEYEYPELLPQINPENQLWWRRFEARPRISGLAVLAWLGLSMLVAMLMVAKATEEGRDTSGLAWCAGIFGLFLVMSLVRIYLIEWPILLLGRRHPPGTLPLHVRGGWLVDSLVLLLVALAARDIPWLGWGCAGFSLLTVLWTAVAAGRPPPLYNLSVDVFLLAHSRVLRIVLRNFAVGLWACLVIVAIHEEMGWPLILCLVAALSCSALGRELQFEIFSETFTLKQQRWLCVGLAALTLTTLVWSAMYGHEREWQPAMLVWTVVCVILSRCFVAATTAINSNGLTGLWLAFMALTVGRGILEVDWEEAGVMFGSTAIIQGGALAFLALVTLGLMGFLWRHRRGTPEFTTP